MYHHIARGTGFGFGTGKLVTDPDMLGRLATAWAGRWDGRWDEISSEAFSVVPTTIYSYAKDDPFDQTGHRF